MPAGDLRANIVLCSMKEVSITLQLQVYESTQQAPSDAVRLLDEARKAMEGAYAPYSKFRVGAAVLLANGVVVRGSNQENASFPEGLCAERVALFAAGAQYPGVATVSIAVVADKLDEGWISPCGGCRQVMLEAETRSGQPMSVILTNARGQVGVLASAATLLPWCFDGHLLSR